MAKKPDKGIAAAASEEASPGAAEPKPAPPAAKSTIQQFFELLAEDPSGPDAQKRRSDAAARTLDEVVAKHPVAATYNVMILHDESSLVRGDADRIYSAIRSLADERDILLVIYSSGGEIEPAFLISQLCRESAKERFVVAVPRRAKSAATLICCGADEIHMGPMSELGPIDPQIGGLPALGLGSALKHIAAIVAEYPASAPMFADYMAKTVKAIDLGYYERVVESAAQYAEQLLNTHAEGLANTPAKIAKQLVYEYMDHSFVIDRREARRILGEGVVVSDSDEYRLANAIYEHLELLRFLAKVRSTGMYWVGSLTTGCHFYSLDD